MSDYQQFNELEWLNENMSRNYPVVGTGNSSLPTSFLVDIQLVLPYMDNVDTSRFFISGVSRTGDAIQVTIGYLMSDPDASVATGFDCAVSTGIPVNVTWPYTNPEQTEYIATEIVPITSMTVFESGSYTYGIPEAYKELRKMSGMLYVGTCVDMQNISSLSFDFKETAIIPIRVYMQPKPGELSEVTLVDKNGEATTFTETMTLIIGDGLTVEVDEEHNSATISVDDAWVEERMDAKVAELEQTAIKTINGIGPAEDGNIQLIGLDCTDINTVAGNTGVITISNPCSKPCCDQNGADSAAISTAMSELIAAKNVLNNYYTELSTKVNSMQARLASLIASRK